MCCIGLGACVATGGFKASGSGVEQSICHCPPAWVFARKKTNADMLAYTTGDAILHLFTVGDDESKQIVVGYSRIGSAQIRISDSESYRARPSHSLDTIESFGF